MTVQEETGTACLDHGRKGFGLGYATAWLVVDGRRFTTTLHRKVHYEHTGELPEVVRHVCDNPRCINPEHLVSGTQKDNVQDMLTKGRMGDTRNFGTANGRAVLTDADCATIRKEYVKGSRTHGLPSLVRKYGASTSQIWRVVNDRQRIT